MQKKKAIKKQKEEWKNSYLRNHPHMSEDDYNKLYAGCLYRLNEAIIPTVAYIRNRYTYGFSYDVYASNLTASNMKMSSFEFTLSRKFGEKRKENRYHTLFD
mgnify:CR=1 FL=1